MTLFVNRFQLLIDHVGIHLGGGNVAVPHQLLQRAKVSTVFKKMYCKAVTQRVGRDLLFDMRGSLIVLQDIPEALTAHANAADIDEQRFLLAVCNHAGTNITQICAQRL